MCNFIKKLIGTSSKKKQFYPDCTRERPSPRIRLTKDNISIDDDGTVIITGAPITPRNMTIADTNSMDGVIDAGHKGFYVSMPNPVEPYRYEDLIVGDICVYWDGSMLIIHQIISIETDSLGRKYTFQGLNNAVPDPYLVRDEHIRYLYIGGVN